MIAVEEHYQCTALVALAHEQREATTASPDGVPVAITSPGCNVMAAEMVEMRRGMEKMS